MRYGYFDDKKREYVITDPNTPFPWINYLGMHDFFSIISNVGGGYCFFKDARLRRILRYRYNNVPLDNNGRFFYIVSGKDVWTPGFRPVRNKLDFYECRHGLGYTIIKGRKNDLEVQISFMVPLDRNAELHKLTLTNKSKKKKIVKIFSFVEFCLWNALDDMTNFQRNLNVAEVEVDGSTIYHKTEYRERRNHYAFYHVNTKIDGFDTDRDSFLGLYNGTDKPETVFKGKPNNSICVGWAPVASHFFEVELKPFEQKEYVFILGYVENSDDKKWQKPGIINKSIAKQIIESFDTSEKFNAALESLKKKWNELLSLFSSITPDEKTNRMINIWNQYQCMVTYNMARSASYFESGIGRGIGFRDTCQDTLGCVHQIPSMVKQRLLDVASIQFEDGGAYHQFQPLTKKGNKDAGWGFNDDPLWLIMAVSSYVKETGDISILKESVPFDNDPSKSFPMIEHLRRSFRHVVENRGSHGLPLIGRADWNDCLNLNCFSKQPDESFQTCANVEGKTAESILIAGMFVFIGPEYAKLCRLLNMNEEAEEALKYVKEMEEAVKKYGWDGEWFLRAYDFYGNKIGSKECKEGKIYIEPQGFCSMARIGEDENMPLKALESCRKYLDSDYGIVLLDPPYSEYYLHLGEISSYPPGYKENGSVFCHNNPWIMIAEAIHGEGDAAYEHYKKISPAWLEDKSDIKRTEPYVYCQTIAGKAAFKPGEAKNSWLTGSAAWNFVAITQWILGIRPDYNGLIIDPCIPSKWKEFKVSRRFRGAVYKITVKNPYRLNRGVKSLIIDGKKIEGNVAPIFNDGKDHLIEAVLEE